MDKRKQLMIQALEKSLGVVTPACKNVDISRDTHYRWLKEDDEYAKAVKDLDNVALDFAESQLHKQINEGNNSATIFYLKTKGKVRGYIEKQEFDMSSSDGTMQPQIIEIVGVKPKHSES